MQTLVLQPESESDAEANVDLSSASAAPEQRFGYLEALQHHRTIWRAGSRISGEAEGSAAMFPEGGGNIISNLQGVFRKKPEPRESLAQRDCGCSGIHMQE